MYQARPCLIFICIVFLCNSLLSQNFVEIQKLFRSDIPEVYTGALGASLSIDGNLAVLGAPSGGGNQIHSGMAVILERNITTGLWEEVTRIIPSDGFANDNFGISASINGNTVVIGASFANPNGDNSGAAYVFSKDQGGVDQWGEVKKLISSDNAADDRFGFSVAVDGDYIVVGAQRNDDNGDNSGSAYIFSRDLGGTDNWGELKKLLPSDGNDLDRFGGSVSISQDYLIIGTAYNDDLGSQSGAAYIFKKDLGGADNWGQLKIIRAIGGTSFDWFGISVDIQGDYAIVGAPEFTINLPETGSAYVFNKDQGGTDNWGQVKKLIASDGVNGDKFGISVSIDGQYAIVGANEADGSSNNSGAAYIFDQDEGGADAWGEIDKLISADGVGGDDYGSAIAISGQTTLVGAKLDDDINDNSGSSYVHEYDPMSQLWPENQKITAGLTGASDRFGYSVATHGEFMVIGVERENELGHNSGTAYLYQRSSTRKNPWTLLKKIVAPDGMYEDLFGTSVAIYNDIIMVGATNDDDLGSASGSVYIFKQDLGGPNNWGFHKKLLANNGMGGGQLGNDISIYEDYVIVGAEYYDGLGFSNGAAYIFKKDQGGLDNWGQIKMLTAANPGFSDTFGNSVSLYGDYLIVGAELKDDFGSSSGAAYLYGKDEGGIDNWGLIKTMSSMDIAAGDNFGSSVSIFETLLIISSKSDDDSASNSGSVYMFSKDEGGVDQWGQIKKITAFDAASGDQFGFSSSLFEDQLVIGSYFDDDLGDNSGSAYLFSRNVGGIDNWGFVNKLIPADGLPSDYFGYDVSASENQIVIGAYQSDPVGNISGSAYIFEKECQVNDFISGNPIDNYYYQASQLIEGQGMVQQNGNVIFGARTVCLLPDFEVSVNAQFEARIDPCTINN